MTVLYAQIYTHLKMLGYPIHPDYHSLVIKFNIFGLQSFIFLRPVLLEEVKGIHKLCINYACIASLVLCMLR